MTQIYRHTKRHDNRNDYRGRGDDLQHQVSPPSTVEETVTIVPVQQEWQAEVESSTNRKTLGLKSKATILAQELNVWRSNMDLMADQIQSLLEREGAAAERAHMLNEITSHIRESLNPTDIFNATVEDARQAIGADRVIVYRFDSQLNGKVVAESVEAGWPVTLGIKITDPCFADRYAQAYQKGRVQAIADIYEGGLTDCHIAQLEPLEVKANLVAPILTNQKLIGLLIAHQCSEPRSWTDSEIEFFRQLAVQVGYALDQGLLLKRQQTAAKQARLLNEITLQLRQFISTEEIFDAVVEEAREALGTDRVVVYQFDPQWQGTVVAESVGRGWPTALGATIADPCFAQRYIKPYLRGRVSATGNIYEAGLTECHLKQLEPFGVKANLVAPIVAQKQLHSLLIAHQCSEARTWKSSEVDFIKQLATQVGFALEQVSLLQQQQTAIERARRLNQITSNLQKSLNPEDIFNSAVEDTQDVLQADRVLVYQFDPQWQGTVVAEAVVRGWPVALGAQITDPCFAQRYVNSYLKGRVQATENIYEAGLTECHLQQLEPFAVQANLVAPIVENQKLYGLLIAHHCSKPRKWQPWEIDFVREVAIQVGYNLEHSLLLQQQQIAAQQATQLAQQARQLNEISVRILESLEPERIFRIAVDESLKLMQADRIVIYSFDENWDGKIVVETVKPGWPQIINMETDVPCFPADYVEPYRKGRVSAIADVTKAGLTPCHEEQLGKWQVKANVVVPILLKQKLYGLLGAHQCSVTREWQESEIEVFKQVALQVGYALEQALLIKQVEQAREAAEQVSIEQRQQKEMLQDQIEAFLGEIEGSFSGDLTVRARVTAGAMGTVADFFNATVESLQQLVRQVQSSATVATTTAKESESDVKRLSTEALRQAEAISAALNQVQVMANSIQKVATNAQAAEIKVQQANHTLKSGDLAMDRTVDGILAIQQTVEATARKVKRLGDASQKISRVVSLISDLANQTNLLALNASVEATRAGEDDHGFGLVANEVRSLAEQSASATQEIEQIVEAIQADTNEVVTAMEAGMERVLTGTELVQETRQTIADSTAVSAKILQLIEEIAQSATAQAQTSGDLSNTIKEVAAIANQTSEQSVIVADSFTQLLGVATQLQDSVAQFKVK
ncbi:MAG: GAF domain-containing protein [Symploca sp. SIO2D2]|nr:GAF domain-containing protein [Symploca sp. SIO2D2]